MQNKKAERLKGKGWFVNEYNKIYVCGTVNKKFHRISTGDEATSHNLSWIKHTPKGELSNARTKLLELLGTEVKIVTDFETFGRAAIDAGAKKKRPDGSFTRKGRAVQAQKTAHQAFDNHILPFFKNFKLEEINASLVEQWQEEKDEEGYATDSINKWTNYLSQIMDRAVKFEVVQTNKVKVADSIEVSHQKRVGYTVKEARSLIKNATGLMSIWLPLMFTTALRVGEGKGIKVSDIDFALSCIYIERAINGSTIVSSSNTKNHSRVVYLLPHVADLLKVYIKEEKKNKNSWLFETKNKDFFKSSQTLTKYYLEPLLKKCKLKGTLGMTRKTFASIADGYVMDYEMIQETMGHRAGSPVTKEHYITPMMTNEKSKKGVEALSPINDVLFGQILKKG